MATVTGQVFRDVNGSTVYETGIDTPVAGAVVTARVPGAGTSLATATSDAAGQFSVTFPTQAVDSVFLSIDPPTGLIPVVASGVLPTFVLPVAATTGFVSWPVTPGVWSCRA